MTASNIGQKAFQSNYDNNTGLRPDGQNANTYEGSEIDNYLEKKWYPSLSVEMKKLSNQQRLNKLISIIIKNMKETMKVTFAIQSTATYTYLATLLAGMIMLAK